MDSSEIEILRKNIYELEKSLHEAYIRIRDLIEENIDLKHSIMLSSEKSEGSRRDEGPVG